MHKLSENNYYDYYMHACLHNAKSIVKKEQEDNLDFASFITKINDVSAQKSRAISQEQKTKI